MEEYLKNIFLHSMGKHIIIFQVSSTTKEIHMVFHRKYIKKNNSLEYNQIQYGIIQVQEE